MLSLTPRPDLDVVRDLATISLVPAEYLSGVQRTALERLARLTSVYAYTPAGAEGWDRGNLWIEALADVRGDRDGRVALATWRDCWQTILGVIEAGHRQGGAA